MEFEDWDEDPEVVVVAVEFELGGAEEGGVMTGGDVGRKAFRPTTPAAVNIAARIISIMIIAAIALKYPLFKRAELR